MFYAFKGGAYLVNAGKNRDWNEQIIPVQTALWTFLTLCEYIVTYYNKFACQY